MRNEITFFLTASLTLGLAAAAMTLQRLVHCALCAAGAFAGLGVIYLQLDAQYVGFAQLLVYVGAIAMLMVFAILLTRGDEVRPGQSQASPGWLSGLAAAGVLVVAIVLPILASPSMQGHATPPPTAPPAEIGVQLMTRYVLPLEMVGILLTAALLGAVVLAMRDEPEIKRSSLKSTKRRSEPVEAEVEP